MDYGLNVEKMKQMTQDELERVLNGVQGGISLAQMPNYVRKSLPFDFDVKSLGYPKLKDFVADDPRFKVQNRGQNYPQVELKATQSDSESYNKKEKQISETSPESYKQTIYQSGGSPRSKSLSIRSNAIKKDCQDFSPLKETSTPLKDIGKIQLNPESNP